MDFSELEAMEGLRWPWHSWPPSRSAAASLVVPLSVLCTPLAPLADVPLLPYEPLRCSRCGGALNPYARVTHRSALWSCPLCAHPNPFPRSYAGIGPNNLPAELFPTYSTVEYLLPPSSSLSGSSASSVFTSASSLASSASSSEAHRPPGPAFVFAVDVSTAPGELAALKGELLHTVARLPENALVGLVSFGGMVWAHDLGFTECARVLVLSGDREMASEKIQELLGLEHGKLGMCRSIQKQGFLLPVSECEFSITSAIEDLNSLPDAAAPGHRPRRATGAAISTSAALLEACTPNSGGRVMVFTSGPASVGPGMIVGTDLGDPIRGHQDIVNGLATLSDKARGFYKQLAERLSDRSIVLDLFACSLDQVGAAELRCPVETSGGLMVLAESFESEQFKKCLQHMFNHGGADHHHHLNMNFEATIEIVATKEVKIRGALGPCMSLGVKKGSSVSEKGIGQCGTSSWKLSTLTGKTCLAFFFEANGNETDRSGSGSPVFFIQFLTRYRHGNGGVRLRVTTAARRWAGLRSPEITAGFDQEAAAVVVARLAVHRAEEYHPRDVVRWIDKMLIRFASNFGGYAPEDPSTFRLSPGFALYPQFMYHLRRSQLVDVFNSTPDETAFFRVTLNREGVEGSLVMIQPTLHQYSFDGPGTPVLLDVGSVSPDVILLFDSYFRVVIHYGSNVAEWRRQGYEDENFRKLLEAPEVDAAALVKERVPVPMMVKCDQHSSQARFLLARLNPSVTQKTQLVDGSQVIFTDDVSLQSFLEHLQELAVQG